MSTNDTVIMLANGLAGNKPLRHGTPAFKLFQRALDHVTRNLARMIVEDGEGVTKFVEVHVNGATQPERRAQGRGGRGQLDARRNARGSAATRTGAASWMRSAIPARRCARRRVDIFYDGIIAVKGGMPSKTPFAKLQEIVAQKKFTITIDLHLGSAEYTVFTTDLSTDYVKLNMGE